MKANANMELEFKTVKGMQVPILKNKCEIAPFTKLVRFVQAPVAADQKSKSDPASSSAAKKPWLSKASKDPK